MQQDIQHYAAVNESLEKQLEVLKSDEYVEKTAREKLGLVMPGEVQYMLITFKGKE
jgi:cell division protein FtsB